MPKLRVLLLFVCISMVLISNASNYPGVLFGSSTMPGNYAYSQVVYKGQSWVENVRGRLPLSDTLFFTPSNALSLKYASVQGGHWQSNLYFTDRSQNYTPKKEEVLSFRMYVHEINSIKDLPLLSILQLDSQTITLPLTTYLDSLPYKTWIHVQIPLVDFVNLSFDRPISGMIVQQGLANSSQTAHILLDQIEFATRQEEKSPALNFPAVLSTVEAYDRHVDLTWQLPLTTHIRYIKIYRSTDQEHFEPIALRPIFATKYTDVVPLPNINYYYRITWVDAAYQESPASKILEANMQPATDDQLLDFIQASHIYYFGDHVEINSGMHKAVQGFQEATISIGETGLSLMAQVVGVEKGLIHKALLSKRVLDILKFLKKAQEYHGVFPEYLNGRTGQGVFSTGEVPSVSLKGTSTLLQGLMVASAYLNQKEISIQVEGLYKRIRWDKFVKAEEGGTILYDHWSPMTNFKNSRAMGGYNADWFTYVLALSAKTNGLKKEAYTEGYGIARGIRQVMQVESALPDLNEVQGNHSIVGNATGVVPNKTLEIVSQSILSDTLIYGLPVRMGRLDQSLLVPYEMFFAFNPKGKRDTFGNYFENNILLTEAYRRRDQERNIGNFSLDIWGVEAGDTIARYGARIIPAISAASYAYTPEVAIKSIRRMYQDYGAQLYTEYGFRTWINFRENAVSEQYNALNQAAVVIMIENARTGLIWNALMHLEPIQTFQKQFFTPEP